MMTAFTNTEDAVMRKQLIFSTGTIVTGVVAFRYSIASDHGVIVDQFHRDDGNLQGPATG